MSDEQKASRHSAASEHAYSDIPDSEDFDRYGVWVKAGPEDVEEGETSETAEADFALDDLSGEEFEPSGDETMLTDEEENALADLESEESEFALEDFGSLEGEEETGESQQPDAGEMPLELDGEALSIESEAEETSGESSADETGGMEDLDESVSEDILDVDIDLDEDIDAELEDLALDLGEEAPAQPERAGESQPETSRAQEPAGEDMEDIEELSLDDLDTLDLEPESDESESPGELSGAEEPMAPSVGTGEEADEGEELDLDSIPGEDTLEDFDFETDEEDESSEELPELGGEEEEEESPIPVAGDDEDTIDAELASVLEEEEPSGVEGIDTADFESAEEYSPTEEGMSTAGTPTGGGRDESSVLVNIEKELLAIKNELNELKQELSTLRAGGARHSSTEEPGEDMEVSLGAPSGERGGFFEQEEEEDETIALTGDELDHILDTAEFTEQPGQPTEYDDLDLRLDDSLSPDQGSEASTQEPATEESHIGEEGPGSPIEEITLEDMGESSPLEDLESGEGLEEPDTDELEELDLDLDTTEETAAAEAGPQAPAEEESPQDFSVEFDELTSSGDEGDVDALADMDVDSELADIEELSDEPGEESGPDTSDIESIEIELPGEEEEEGESGFAGADTEVDEFDASLGEPVLEIPEEGEAEPEPVSEPEPEDLDTFDLEEELERAETPQPSGGSTSTASEAAALPENLKQEIRSVLSYMDQLLESLPEEKIEEFARSEHFEVYKRLFEELGLENE